MGDHIKRLIEQLIDPDTVGLCPRAIIRVEENKDHLMKELKNIIEAMIVRLYE